MSADRTRLFGALPTFRRPTELQNALSRVNEQTRKLDLLVVVDNSPTTATEEIVRRYASDGNAVKYVPSDENLGFCGGVRLGMEHILEFADDDDWIVVFDDDDPLPYPSVFEALEGFASRMLKDDPRTAAIGLVGARFNWRRGGLTRIEDPELSGPVAVDFIGGNHFPFYRVGAIRDVGPFSDRIFFGLSEIEHGLRLRAAGYSVYAHGSLWRELRAKAGRMDRDIRPSRGLGPMNWRRYYSLRNAIYILRYHQRTGSAVRLTLVKGLGKPLANLFTSPGLALSHLRMNMSACWDGWMGRMGRTIEPDGSARPQD